MRLKHISFRLLAVPILALAALWLVTVSASYLRQDWQLRIYQPAPQRIQAIIQSVEQVPPAQRPALLRAFSSFTIALSLLPPAPSQTPDRPHPATAQPIPDTSAPPNTSKTLNTPKTQDLRYADESLMRLYQDAVGDHPFTILTGRETVSDAEMPHFKWQTRRMVEFQIGLKEGGTLIIRARSPTIATHFGLPLGMGAGLAGTLIGIIAVFILLREIRPLSLLAHAADRIDLNGTPVDLPSPRGQSREIKAVIAALDRLQRRLSSVLHARMALLGGISHDLRTFSTRLRFRIEAIPDPITRNRAARDIDDMIQLLDNALLATRADSGALTEEMVDLPALIAAEVEERKNQQQPVFLTTPFPPPSDTVFVLGDRVALRRILVNVIENALIYGQEARIAVRFDDDTITIEIADNGPGIPPELRDTIIEPFVRHDPSRSRETGGAGLGLAVTRTLLEAQGGGLCLDPERQNGATVSLSLPRFKINAP